MGVGGRSKIYIYIYIKKNWLLIVKILIKNTNLFKQSGIIYIKGLSEYIKKILFVHNIQATFKPTNSLSVLFSKLKDRDPLLNQNNLVYKIDCLNCDGTLVYRTD